MKSLVIASMIVVSPIAEPVPLETRVAIVQCPSGCIAQCMVRRWDNWTKQWRCLHGWRCVCPTPRQPLLPNPKRPVVPR